LQPSLTHCNGFVLRLIVDVSGKKSQKEMAIILNIPLAKGDSLPPPLFAKEGEGKQRNLVKEGNRNDKNDPLTYAISVF